MYGYNGKYLEVNLTTGETTVGIFSDDEQKSLLGGRGFIIPWLLRKVPGGADPLGPENILVFATGPFTGYLPGGGRNSVGAKSPLTGTFGEAEAGGFFGGELKRSGFDAVMIEGKSDKPVTLVIENGTPRLMDAGALWGKDTAETEQALHEVLGSTRFRTAVIGPAGENGVAFASLHNDITHVYGRNGLGAVMGSKNMKAVAVRGDKLPELADKKALNALSRQITKNAKKSPLATCGTGLGMAVFNESGNLPVHNFVGGRFDNVTKTTAGALCEQDLLIGMHTCPACPINCKKEVMGRKPRHIDPVYGGPEYETLAAFGSNCGIDDIFAIAKAHELCNSYGMDTISAGVVVSFAMECFENGLITAADTGGLELRFGNADALVEMMHLIGRQEGIGKTLAEGSARAAQKIGNGADQYAMHVKGLELPMHDPRHNQSFALHYSTHFGGADHCTGCFEDADGRNLGRFMVEGQSPEIEAMPSHELGDDKARFLYDVGIYRHLANHFGLCIFVPWGMGTCLQALAAITGWEATYEDLRQTVDRTVTMARVFNLREGFTADDDSLPKRFQEPHPNGALAEVSLKQDDLIQARQAFYRNFGWNVEGVPTEKSLAELGISWCRNYLSD